ncbi:YXWGXW repeat-containing protein [Ottowia sp.]|uniref:YXWGXW repeat-containing protein n=1 Tax=Ottowia sp. TaxID=1898956 RepID=UPI003A89F091
MIRTKFSAAVLAGAALLGGSTAFLWPAAAQAQVAISVQIGPPPARRAEHVPPPRQGYVWAAGHYEWLHGQYIWRRGHWMKARAGYAYIEPAWVADGPRWVYQPERWERRTPPSSTRSSHHRQNRGYDSHNGYNNQGRSNASRNNASRSTAYRSNGPQSAPQRGDDRRRPLPQQQQADDRRPPR